MSGVPALEPHCGSWIVRSSNGHRVFETFRRDTAERAKASGWVVETAAQYLGRINRELRAARGES